MAYRNLMVENVARISCRNRQLIVKGVQDHSVPIEDINAVMLENRQSTITVAALSQLAIANATLYVCDEKHIPCGVLTSFNRHSRQLAVLKLQEQLSVPAKKRLWQQIVKAKINNQASCCLLCQMEDEAYHLQKLAATVTSGDAENVEGVAAGYYFNKLFGRGFTRGDGLDCRNAALNYGYAILRGNIARLLVSYGFIPAWGLHHRSELNAYNLADDLIEPFRPLVDLYVVRNISDTDSLNPKNKRALFNLLNMEMQSGEQKHSAAYAAERLVHSLLRCYGDYQNRLLLLPVLLELQQHQYE